MGGISSQTEVADAAPAIVGSATPADLNIQSRNRHFANAAMERRHWVGGDPYATAFFNALSITFPKGETFFMKVLKQYRDEVPEKLAREIRGFVQQEAVHSREHLFFNKHIEESDFDISRLEQTLSDVIDNIASKPLIMQLVATTCLEHLTAIMAAEFIANPKHFQDADEEQRKMWLWHASEEVEHKGVAYDTWLYATRDWSRAKRWATKSLFMARISLGFAKNRTKGIFDLLRQDGISGPRAWFGFLHYALIGPAPFRRTLLPWFHFFLPGFHPWNKDDRGLIQLAESEYEAAIMDPPEQDDNIATLGKHEPKKPLNKVA
ncbi:metal-dependent hydrolase [Sphingorhabdus sp. Alg231-15]|uniref:metal-dependent hydrolase n=1 Tax=Sphingorhabdus sp. Alg231-15 TaxID=1922222 RepID=UPI000D5603D3